MINHDYHIHTTFSTDGKSAMEEALLAAKNRSLRTICFTEHMDYDNPYDEGPGAFILDTDSYLSKFQELSNKYCTKDFQAGFGVEIGLQPHLSDFYSDYLDKYPFDFCIGSTHVASNMDPALPAYFDSFKTNEAAYRNYFETELENARRVSSYDVFGHIDYVLRYSKGRIKTFAYEEYEDVLDELLSTIVGDGKGIEINTAGLRKGLEYPNPHPSILKRYRELGGEIITVGSDAHSAKDIAKDFDRAEEILKSAGFKYYTIFQERKPKFLKL